MTDVDATLEQQVLSVCPATASGDGSNQRNGSGGVLGLAILADNRSRFVCPESVPRRSAMGPCVRREGLQTKSALPLRAMLL